MLQTLGISGALLLVLLGVIFYAISRYKVVGRDMAMVITGSALGSKNVETDDHGKKIKIVVGGGAVVLPIIHRMGTVSLQPSNLSVEAKGIVTKEDVPINVIAVATVKFYSDTKNLINAAENYLGVPVEHREQQIRQILEGHLKAIIATLTVEESNKHRDLFSEKVRAFAEHSLQKLGIEIVNFSITHVTDDHDFINALSQRRIAEVKRDSELARSLAEKEERIGKAQNNKEAKEAEFARASEVAAAKKDNELQLAEFKIVEDTAKANAEIAFNLQTTQRQQELRKKEIEIEIVEREKKIELEELEIKRREKQYEAEVFKRADAEYYQKVKESEAERIRVENQSLALRTQEINKAEAEARKVELEGLAKAKAILAEGEATASTIEKRGMAEANVLREKAAAFEEFGQAAILDMIIKMLPEYAKQVASPLANIDKITVVDTGGSGPNGGANKITSYATNLMATLQESLKASSGIDVKELIENYSGKSNVRKSIEELTDVVEKQAE